MARNDWPSLQWLIVSGNLSEKFTENHTLELSDQHCLVLSPSCKAGEYGYRSGWFDRYWRAQGPVQPNRTGTIEFDVANGVRKLELDELQQRQILLSEVVFGASRLTALYNGGDLTRCISPGFRLLIRDRISLFRWLMSSFTTAVRSTRISHLITQC